MPGCVRPAMHHAVGQALAVPVDGGGLGQSVGDEDAHAVAFDHLDGGAGRLAVVAPQVGGHAGCHLAFDRLGHQVELLDAGVHAPGQGPAVERDHRVVGPPGGGGERRHGVGRGLQHGLGQGGHRGLAHGAGGDRRADRAGALEEVASVRHGCVPERGEEGGDERGAESAMSRSARASQKSRCAWMAPLTLWICVRASASRSNTLMSMPL